MHSTYNAQQNPCNASLKLSLAQVWQCVDKDTRQIMDCQKACTVPSSCAVHANQKCGSSIIYDTPETSIYPSSECTLHCEEKSGTCRKKKGNDVLTTL